MNTDEAIEELWTFMTMAGGANWTFLQKSGKAVPRVREIGNALYQRHGMGGLFVTSDELTRRTQNQTKSARLQAILRELDFAWNDIGTWQA